MCKTKNHMCICYTWTMNSSGFQCDLPDHLTGYIIYIWLCYFRHLNAISPKHRKNHPKRALQIVLEPQIHHVNGLFFQDSRKPMIFLGGLRYPFTNDSVDGTTSSHSAERCFISTLMATKIKSLIDFSREKDERQERISWSYPQYKSGFNCNPFESWDSYDK